jgi:pimeloyl-ACP methyl ester carboxylesterase
VIAVLDDLGVDRADVYGTSMGGRVAQQLAARHPDRVRALVLGCTSPGGPHAVERTSKVRRSLVQTQPGAARRALLELMYTPAWLAENPGPYRTLGAPGMPAHAQRRHLAASNQHDAWQLLPDIGAPTLVLHGTDDLLNPAANAPLLADRIPDARLDMIPGARHAYFEEFRAPSRARSSWTSSPPFRSGEAKRALTATAGLLMASPSAGRMPTDLLPFTSTPGASFLCCLRQRDLSGDSSAQHETTVGAP